MLNDPEIALDLDTEVVPEPETPPAAFDLESVGLARRIIDEDGFGLVDMLTDADRSELFRLGYEIFYFAVDTAHGPVNKIVATVPGKSYNEAETWFMSKIVNNAPKLEEPVEPDPSTFPILDLDNLRIPIRDKFLLDQKNDRWNETPESNEAFFDGVAQTMLETLDRDGIVFINDILPKIGFKITRLGQFYGWIKGDEIIIEHTRIKDGAFYFSFPNAHYILDEIGD